jgi:hypothetical protein
VSSGSERSRRRRKTKAEVEEKGLLRNYLEKTEENPKH